MSIACRVIKGGQCEITQEYKGSAHAGIDLVNKNYTLGTIIAHSAGTVVGMRNDCKGFEQGSYGNYVKIKHDNGYYTLYAHGQYNSVKVKNGQRVDEGTELFAMGNTGYSFGGHLHFEVRNTNDTKIDPTPYINADLPGDTPEPIPTPTHKYKIGDVVKINGVYVSSTSDKKLKPAITKGTITRIVDARNPYLLDNGNIGWVNDDCIITDTPSENIKTVVNCYWLNLRTIASYGNNIYKAVKAGTKVNYLGMENGWAKIKYEDKVLYCGAGYLG